MPDRHGEHVEQEQCGFCTAGKFVVTRKTGSVIVPCPYCNGTGRQEPPHSGRRPNDA